MKGIIRSFKSRYRKNLVEFLVERVDEGTVLSNEMTKRFPIAFALWWLIKAWRDLPKSIIINCFKKCGIGLVGEEVEDTIEDYTPQFVQAGIDSNDIMIEEEVETFNVLENPDWESDILSPTETFSEEEEHVDYLEADDESEVTVNELNNALNLISRYAANRPLLLEKVMLFIEDIGHIRRNNLIQTTLDDFLRK
jgi:hypothetical protein